MNPARLHQIVSRFAQQRILVLGDLMLDEFIWGKVSRISPEAPVPVVNVTAESYYPGGAANVARNLREFTPQTALIGLAGTDGHSQRLMDLLHASSIDTSGVQQDGATPMTVKTRVVARNQQLVRIDRERAGPATAQQTGRAIADLDRMIGAVDGIVVADYGKGFVTQALADHLCEAVRAHGKILTVDPHPHTSIAWRGATAIKPNRAEAFLAAGLPQSDPVEPVLSDHALLEAVSRLLGLWQTPNLLVTLGEQGMLLFQDGRQPYHIPTCAKDVFDVSGAGDTAISVLTLGLCAGADPTEAAELANRASGIVVGKFGTATLNAVELLAQV